MATTPTQLPVPSEKPQDLKFNAGKVDEFVTSMGWTYSDRFGVKHYTIEGLRHIAQQAISAFGYITIDSFEDGATLSLPNQILRWKSNGEYYRWDGEFPKAVASGSTPEMAGGIGNGKWLGVGAAALSSTQDGAGDALVAVKQPFTGAIESNQHEKNSQTIDFRDFGGMPSLSDNSVNLQNAINALSTLGGGTLNITLPGVYLIGSGVTLASNITFNLSQGVIFRKNFAGGTMWIINKISASNIVISGGTLDGNGPKFPTPPFNICSFTGVRNLVVKGVTFLDVADDHALDMADFQDVTVRDCKFMGFANISGVRDFSEAIQCDPSILDFPAGIQNKNLTVDNCYFGPNPNNTTAGWGSFGSGVGNHASAYGIQDSGFKITNCRFLNMGFAGVRVFNWKDYQISGCSFEGGTARGVHVTPFPSTTKPQGSRNGRIIGNNFFSVRSPVLLAAAPNPFTDVSDIFHQDIVISNNTMVITATDIAAIDARWCSSLTVTGNVVTGGNGLLSGRFLNKAVIANNQFNNGTDSGIWITEADATTFIGTGLSYDIVVANNTLRNIGLNGIHISGALKFVTVSANIIVGASTADNSHNAIRVDGGANGVVVVGNQARDGGAVNKPTVGLIFASTCSDVVVSSNVSYGTSASHNNGATGASSLAIFGGVGSPSTTGVGAPIGSIFLRSDGGALTTLYVKESGTTAVGWVAK